MSDIHSINTRNASTLLCIPVHRTTIFNRAWIVQAVNLYNELEPEIRNLCTLDAFKRAVKNSLLRQYTSDPPI